MYIDECIMCAEAPTQKNSQRRVRGWRKEWILLLTVVSSH